MIPKAAKLTLSGVVIVFAALIAAYALNYLRFTSTEFLQNKDIALTANIFWQIPFYLHVTLGAVALFVGGFQFIEPLRDRYIRWHRLGGKIYVASVCISSVTGFTVAIFAEAGLVAKLGFAFLAIAWFYANYRAYTAIRQVRIVEHRAWMIRNYALTFAAVTLRIWLPLELAVLEMNFPDAYRLVAWLSWVPNLLFAELLVYRLRAAQRPAI